jgi:PTH2 family peptidyl-tRNA hydrolase
MPAGKLSSQAGHAYTDTIYEAYEQFPDRVKNYRNRETGGSKVTLHAKNEQHLIDAYWAAKQAGLPCAIVVDSGHILPPFFDGNPIITAVGIGPCTKSECQAITKRFNCVQG